MVEIEEMPPEEEPPKQEDVPPTDKGENTSTTTDDDGWEKLMGDDLVLKVSFWLWLCGICEYTLFLILWSPALWVDY